MTWEDGRGEVEKWVWSSGNIFRWLKPQKWLKWLSLKETGSQGSRWTMRLSPRWEGGRVGRVRSGLHLVHISVVP